MKFYNSSGRRFPLDEQRKRMCKTLARCYRSPGWEKVLNELVAIDSAQPGLRPCLTVSLGISAIIGYG